MPAKSLNMDGDDASELVVEIEGSFDVTLGKDLRHIKTVGDLHTAIVCEIGDASGDACPTSRTFYRIRAIIGAEGARPNARLDSIWRGSPHSLRRHLRDQTGWAMPPPTIGWYGCVAVSISVVVAVILGWKVSGWIIPPVLAGGLALLRVNRGSWIGDWVTLGSLAGAIAARNQATLNASGARQSPVTTWHALTTLIAGYGVERDSIARETRLCG